MNYESIVIYDHRIHCCYKTMMFVMHPKNSLVGQTASLKCFLDDGYSVHSSSEQALQAALPLRMAVLASQLMIALVMRKRKG